LLHDSLSGLGETGGLLVRTVPRRWPTRAHRRAEATEARTSTVTTAGTLYTLVS
jgi:hypothetical protein